MNRPLTQMPSLTGIRIAGHSVALMAIQEAIAQKDLKRAATEVATIVAREFRCTYVGIGLTYGRKTDLVALSGVADVCSKFELPRQVIAGMYEAVDQCATVRYPVTAHDALHITLMHRQLADSALGGMLLTVPLPFQQHAIGALMLIRNTGEPWSDQEKEQAEHLAVLIGPVLHLKYKAHEPLWSRLYQFLRQLPEQVRMPGVTTYKLWLLGVCVVLAGTCLVPVQDAVTARAHLEGAVQRSIAAPIDSFIQSVLVRPGSEVAAGQPLLTLSDQDMRLERSRIEAELGRYRSEQADAFAQKDRSRMVNAQAHIDELSAQLTLLQDQIARTRIVAPFAGVIIRGDQQQQAGAPVKRGDVLLILSPGSDFKLILQVHERDIAALKPGQTGQVAFSALPDKVYSMKVSRITPVSAIVDGSNTFEIEAQLDSRQQNLRPGLEGIAHISMRKRPLAFIWGKRALDWLNFQLWALLG